MSFRSALTLEKKMNAAGSTEVLELIDEVLSGRYDGTFMGRELPVSDIWRRIRLGESEITPEEVELLCLAYVSMAQTAEYAQREIKTALAILNGERLRTFE